MSIIMQSGAQERKIKTDYKPYRPLAKILSLLTSMFRRFNIQGITLPLAEKHHMKKPLLFSLLLFFFSCLAAQTPIRQVKAVRTALSIKIDGDISEEAWKTGALITDLVEMRPSFGKLENQRNKTEIYILYDDNAIYLGGILHEANPDSISTELAGRDAVGVNDFVGVVFDTYQDKINGLGFYVTPLGEQFDAKYAIGNGNEDMSWNAVYHTASKITSEGWSFEMQIPYSAIRFSKRKVQDWGMNILRRRSKSGSQYSWSPVNPANFGFMNQAGTLAEITDIKPPLRLSFAPYFSTYLTNNPYAPNQKWDASINGGMDLKYGISDAFTMDMTLIPDFGQVQSDNQVLNLTPFEVQYDEYRPFFNEGTELFNKGNLFYSRRIGGQPIHFGDVYDQVSPGETILTNPSETKLLNATKISGRTPKKLGIGFFNAVTRPEYAVVEKSDKEHYKLETSPLTNYNVVVLDQAMKNNSSITLVNTNVWRSGKDYEANVTAFLWDLYDNKVNWNVWGQVTQSALIGKEAPGKTATGYYYNVFLGKFKGRFNFDIHRFLADEKYDQRDMGYFTNNNYVTHGFYAGYKWLKPRSFYNNIYLNLNGNYSEMYLPRQYQYLRLNANVNSQLKSLWVVGMNADIRPQAHDYYEPRVTGKMVKLPTSWMTSIFASSNRAKKYSANLQFSQRRSSMYDFLGSEIYFGNSYRFNNKLSVGLSGYIGFYDRDFGFAYTADADSSIFGLRDRRTVENVLESKYNFNNKMGITFRLRHYWSQVHYSQFFNLKNDGEVEDLAQATQNPDDNVNYFNIDMIYIWQFAPGSFINIAWKNAAALFDQDVQDKYFANLGNTMEKPQQNSLSLKVIYYLDYLKLKKKHKS